jgi:hypothetical protein
MGDPGFTLYISNKSFYLPQLIPVAINKLLVPVISHQWLPFFVLAGFFFTQLLSPPVLDYQSLMTRVP